MLTETCANCGAEFRTFPSWQAANRRSCSSACRNELRRGKRRAADTRFWENVEVRAPHECWLWTGGTSGNGYGRMKVGGRETGSHRLSYRLHCCHPAEPDVVMHICDEPLCVNPLHLRAGDLVENRMDCVRKGRHATGESNGRSAKNRARFEITEER